MTIINLFALICALITITSFMLFESRYVVIIRKRIITLIVSLISCIFVISGCIVTAMFSEVESIVAFAAVNSVLWTGILVLIVVQLYNESKRIGTD